MKHWEAIASLAAEALLYITQMYRYKIPVSATSALYMSICNPQVVEVQTAKFTKD